MMSFGKFPATKGGEPFRLGEFFSFNFDGSMVARQVKKRVENATGDSNDDPTSI